MNKEAKVLEFITAARTDVGTVREVNEDAFIANPEDKLWAVADGMGGHHVGDVASNKVIAALDEIRARQSLADYARYVEDVLHSVNFDIVEFARENFGDATMGTTLCCMLASKTAGACIWIGDSRLYRLRHGKLDQLSTDHSQVQEMLDMGLLNEDEAKNHPNGNVITRAVGVEEELYPEVTVFSIERGDCFLICSDGLYGAVDESFMADQMSSSAANDCVDNLIEKALAEGANDNVTVIVVDVN